MKNENNEASKPISTANIGSVRAAVFANDTEYGTRYKTVLECTYKDAEGNWQSTKKYDLHELLAVRELAGRAIDEILNLQNRAV